MGKLDTIYTIYYALVTILLCEVMEKGYICFHWFIVYISCILTTLFSLIPNTINNQYRGGDCHQAFLPHRECVCYDRCPRCCVELELDVNFDKVNQTRPDQEKDLPLTVTSRDLVSVY